MEHKRILIVDDIVENLTAIVETIEEEKPNYTLYQALSGKDALQIATVEIPDLIITDWEMPEMSGLKLIEALREVPETADIPVIMCTGIMKDSDHLRMALDSGAVDYIRKPLDKVELLARIQSSLKLSESYYEIKRLNDAKDQFFNIIAHDLRGPIGNIKEIGKHIVNNPLDYNQKELIQILRMVEQQSSTVYIVLENLLAWANSQRNNIDFFPEEQPFSIVTQSCLKFLSRMLLEKNITLENEIDNDLRGFFDTTLISTVLRNLISNAIKFTHPGGKITLTGAEYDAFIQISVSDTGVGIRQDQVGILFNPDNHITTYGTLSEKGSGLGLKLCADFIRKHHGDIWVESTPDVGTTFYFTLKKEKPTHKTSF